MIKRRRDFIKGAAKGAIGLGVAFAATSVSKVALAALPEIVTTSSPKTLPPSLPDNGHPFHPVVTLNGWSLPWRMKNGWKEFHLVAEPVIREFAPGMKTHLWGYNGQSPGPTIEVVEGDKVRIFVTNRLPEHTTIHWHGQPLPVLPNRKLNQVKHLSMNLRQDEVEHSCITRMLMKWYKWQWG